MIKRVKNKKYIQRIPGNGRKGVTLIALVITIIVLLILAGVSIATLSGENGILTQANKAKEETTKSKEKEILELTVLESISKNQNEIGIDEIKSALNNYVDEENYEIDKISEGILVKFKNGHTTWIIDNNNNVKEWQYDLADAFNYERDGLIILYDGIKNTRNGRDANTKIWENLAEENNDATLKNINNSMTSGWTEKGLLLDGIDDWVSMGRITDNYNITIEIAIKIISSPQNKIIPYIGCFQNGGAGFVKSSNNKIGIEYYTDSYKIVTGSQKAQEGKKYSLSGSYDGKQIKYRENDENYFLDLIGNVKLPEDDTIWAIGTNTRGKDEELSQTQERANIEVYSVRIYNKVLTEKEIKNNYEVDKKRYGI